jgi:isocitrate/isopropylmalate dehydrogenase
MWRTISTHPNSQESGREGSAVTVRLQTRSATEALLTRAFELALARKKKVTVADKPNVLRNSSQLLREVVEQVSADHPGVDVEILNVDAVAMWMVTRPSRFDVIVAENMFGDILSDVGAGVMGGLGLASSANIGDRHAYFEPVHGSAPHLAGSGRANPMAMFLTIASLLEHLGETRSAALVRDAVRTVYREGRTLTYDLGDPPRQTR